MYKYWLYFKYIMKHKYYVFIECWKEGLYLHAFFHDLSKLMPDEFIPYTKYLFNSVKDKRIIILISLKHIRRNKHHSTYWASIIKNKIEPIEMPDKYLKQLVCDWRAASKRNGVTTKDYYIKNKKNITLHKETRKRLEQILGVK